MEYPKVYVNDDGVEIEVRNDIQAAACENGGFYLKEEAPKRKKAE